MLDRIKILANDVREGRVWFNTTSVSYDRTDLFLHPVEMSCKRVCEYIRAQVPDIRETSALAGYLRFDGTVEGDIFGRTGHKAFGECVRNFYAKPIEGLVTFEWQHSEGNFERAIKYGIEGLKRDISASLASHGEREEIIFLKALDSVCDAIVFWAHKCSEYALKASENASCDEYRENLRRLSSALKKIPEKPADTFYEAVLAIYICYPFLPDSIGLIDRQLYPYYKTDIERGSLTEDDARAYLQELFLMLQSRISITDSRFNRGGESHFCVGGYLPDGSDGFTSLTRLVIESLMELPCAVPQISLRWTPKTPREAFKFVLECERKDSFKRIAFVNDVPRIRALTEIVGFSFETAVNYTMVGCNEPVMTGGRILGASHQNVLRSVSNAFQKRTEEIISADSFDSFYRIYEEELFADMERMLELDNSLNALMSRDTNLVSSLFIDGCIDSARSATQGGAALGTSTLDLIGITSVIDSLAIVRQFVYDERRTDMRTLATAVNSNWRGFEELRLEIIKKGKFFGNDDPETNEVARAFTGSIHSFLEDKRSIFGKKYLVGNLIGYNEHHKWFGERTGATPDGRYDGEPMSFGIGQSDGKDRKGVTALLSSVAKFDPTNIMNGASVTNILLDGKLMTDDCFFEKLVILLETYFVSGGTHFQLTYASPEDMKAAKEHPEKYRSLRVRVSGFSDYFVNLNSDLQDEIIKRTVKRG